MQVLFMNSSVFAVSILDIKPYFILQLWFFLQSISLLFKLLVQELDDDGPFDVVSHLKSDTSPKAYRRIIKTAPLVGLKGGCQV